MFTLMLFPPGFPLKGLMLFFSQGWHWLQHVTFRNVSHAKAALCWLNTWKTSGNNCETCLLSVAGTLSVLKTLLKKCSTFSLAYPSRSSEPNLILSFSSLQHIIRVQLNSCRDLSESRNAKSDPTSPLKRLMCAAPKLKWLKVWLNCFNRCCLAHSHNHLKY